MVILLTTSNTSTVTFCFCVHVTICYEAEGPPLPGLLWYMCSVPYAYFIHTRMAHTILPYTYGTILYTIRVRYNHTRMVRTTHVE